MKVSVPSALGAAAVVLAIATGFGASADETRPRAPRQHVEVERILVDVRAVDGRGRPMLGLGADDLMARVGGIEAAVDAVDWTQDSAPRVPPEAVHRLPPGTPLAPAGRMIMMLFQRDLIPSRISGLMRVRDSMLRFIDELEPQDRVAVLTHDKHLQLHTDLTDDRERLRRILEDSIVYHRPPGDVAGSGEPRLAERWDDRAAAEATHAEDALHLLAETMRPWPGSKTILFVGWGLNRWEGATEVLGEALGLMIDGDISMFSLDVTDADAHGLEGPMIQAAGETGGFYARTHVLSKSVMRRVTHALSGHYVVALVAPPGLSPGRHSITIELRGRKGTLYHRASHQVR